MYKNSNFKILKVTNILRPKPHVAIRFWSLFFTMGFKDLILIFFSWALNTTTEDTMKKHPT